MKPTYDRIRVKIRFLGNGGRQCTREQMLTAVLPALWNESDGPDVAATIDHFISLYNGNRVFMYPFPLDLYKTRWLELRFGGLFQHFPWDLPDEDVHQICEVCRDWDFSKSLEPVKPFLIQGSAAAFLCPWCQSIRVDDVQAEKAGATYFLTRKQFKEKFGVDAP